MSTPTLQQIAEQKQLHIVNVDDKDYMLCGTPNFFDVAEEYHLRINILMKDDNKQQYWTLTPLYTFDSIDLNVLINQYMNGEYVVISSNIFYSECARRFINNTVKNGASPSEVEKAINDTKAIERMFKIGKIGYMASLELVMDKDFTQHFLVPRTSKAMASFKGITLAVALSKPTTEDTELAVSLLKAGKPVPCLNGMMPEDISASHSLEDYDFTNYGGMPDNDHLFGSFFIIDSDNMIGYAFRHSWDGVHYFWEDGTHTNYEIVESKVLESCKGKINALLSNSSNVNFVAWMAARRVVFCENSNTCIIPTL